VAGTQRSSVRAGHSAEDAAPVCIVHPAPAPGPYSARPRPKFPALGRRQATM
jgi:hypothetical protein